MDFFEHQDRARRNTFRLIGYFIAAVIGVVLSVYFAAIGIILLIQWQQEKSLEVSLWEPELFAVVAAATLLVIFAGSFYKIWSIGGSGEHVALALGGREVPANTRDLPERILLNVVEEMALASGTPVPPVYLMEEEGINAFAAGTSPQNAVIGVTRGAIETLGRDELQGVIAHEFSHILNGDMRLNIRLMGWLHGILVIAMIGYVILRTMGSTHTSSRSSRSDKKGEGGLGVAILLGAIALIIIGYVGVFFAQLIKAAVSRQREFLADASAVQFTRNPLGLAGALKKIGGWKEQSRIRAPQAEESSHMFFSAALSSTLFATHPPLGQRIQRIDPQFSGAFAETSKVSHSQSEIIDPQALSHQISGFSPLHKAAAAGAQRVAEQPAQLLESVGDPNEKHLEHVHELIGNLEAPLSADIHDPLSAIATVYALLLAHADSDMRRAQVDHLNRQADPRIMSEFKRVLGAVDRLSAEQRLPVAALSLPALHQMSSSQALDFQKTVQSLIRMDRQVTLFEFAVQRFVTKRLAERLNHNVAGGKRQRTLKELYPALNVVLSTLANIGGTEVASSAFAAGLRAIETSSRQQLRGIDMLPASQCNVEQLDHALDELESAAPAAKKHLLAGFTACITFDGHLSVPEAELLRVIADALGCPVPPLL